MAIIQSGVEEKPYTILINLMVSTTLCVITL